MSDGVDYKIRVHDEELDQAAKKAKDLEAQLGASQGNQTKAVKEGVNTRTQIIRDGIAQQLRQVREGAAQEVAVLKEKLKKEEIDQKEFADRYVKIQAEAQRQVQVIKAQKAKLIPTKEETGGGSGMAIGLGFAAGAIGVGALSKELVSLADHASRAKANVEGLESIVRFKLGREAIPEAHKALKDITASGLLSQTDGAAALKNLVSMGYGIDQATAIIQRNTDIAVKNRQAHYSVSEAVRVFTEGVKNGNSVLTDATGITENLEPMLKKYGFSAQDLGDKVNGAAARQALLKEVMKQTEPFVGDAARASNDFTGVMAKLSAQTDETKAAIGRIAAEGFSPLARALTDALAGLTDWFTGLSQASQRIVLFGSVIAALSIPLGVMAASAIAAAGSFTAMAVAVKAALLSLMANPIFLMVAGIVALTAAVVGLIEGGRATPGEQLMNEKRQLDELAKSVELTVEQKKRLAEINQQIMREYGPYLEMLRLEGASYEKTKRAIYDLDEAKKRLGKFEELASSEDFTKKVNELEIKISEMKARVAAQDFPIFGGKDYLQAEIRKAEAELVRLQKAAMKPVETPKTKEAVRVPVIFVRDLTSLEILQDKKFLNDQLLAQDQGLYLSFEIMRQNDRLRYEMDLAERLYSVKNQQGEQLVSLQQLELRKEALERQAANTTDQRKKNELAAAQKHNQQLLDGVKRRIDQERALKQQQDEWSKRAATEMAAFGDAMLSAEKGSLYKYLADRVRAVTRAFAEELYAKAAAYAAMGNFPLAALYGAGGLAVQAAGEFAAREIEKNAPKAETQNVAGPSFDGVQQAPTPQTPGTGGNTTVNNIDARVIVNEHGTYMTESEFIRRRLLPALAQSAAERGRVIFK